MAFLDFYHCVLPIVPAPDSCENLNTGWLILRAISPQACVALVS